MTYASDPSSTVVSSALSPFAADYYSFVGGPNRVVVSAPATNVDSNLRDLYWPITAPAVVDGMSCATWTSQVGPRVQQGAALRIVLSGTTPAAITVTKNIWLGGFWIFNVHEWLGQYSTPIGQFDLGEAFRRPSSDEAVPLPWHICARAVGPVVDFKAWPDGQVEPAWGDPKYGGSVVVSSDWVYPGRTGWYIAHLFPNDTAQFDDLTTQQL